MAMVFPPPFVWVPGENQCHAGVCGGTPRLSGMMRKKTSSPSTPQGRQDPPAHHRKGSLSWQRAAAHPPGPGGGGSAEPSPGPIQLCSQETQSNLGWLQGAAS